MSRRREEQLGGRLELVSWETGYELACEDWVIPGLVQEKYSRSKNHMHRNIEVVMSC